MQRYSCVIVDLLERRLRKRRAQGSSIDLNSCWVTAGGHYLINNSSEIKNVLNQESVIFASFLIKIDFLSYQKLTNLILSLFLLRSSFDFKFALTFWPKT